MFYALAIDVNSLNYLIPYFCPFYSKSEDIKTSSAEAIMGDSNSIYHFWEFQWSHLYKSVCDRHCYSYCYGCYCCSSWHVPLHPPHPTLNLCPLSNTYSSFHIQHKKHWFSPFFVLPLYTVPTPSIWFFVHVPISQPSFKFFMGIL